MNEYTNYEKYRTLCKLTKSELRKVQQLEEQENLPERTVDKKATEKIWKKKAMGLGVGCFFLSIGVGIGITFGNSLKNDQETKNTQTKIQQEENQQQSRDQLEVENTEPWVKNVLMKDEGIYGDDRQQDLVFDSSYKREEILTVTILDRLDAAPEECWDVSEEQNGLVLAWVEEDGTFYDLYIAGEGGINAKYCTKLFDGYVNMEWINLNGHFHTEYATDMTSMFGHCHRLVELDVSNLSTQYVTSMYGMFTECNLLEYLDVSHFDTSQVTSMYAMFNECTNIKELDVSGFDTANVTDMAYMFSNCESLEMIDVSQFNTQKVTTMYAMFNANNSLMELDVSNFNTSNVKDMAYMFNGCLCVREEDTAHFDMSLVTDTYKMFD